MNVADAIEKVKIMFDYNPTDVKEIQKLVKQIEGTDAMWFLIASLVAKNSESNSRRSALEDRVKDLEDIMENMRESFRGKNEYGF